MIGIHPSAVLVLDSLESRLKSQLVTRPSPTTPYMTANERTMALFAFIILARFMSALPYQRALTALVIPAIPQLWMVCLTLDTIPVFLLRLVCQLAFVSGRLLELGDAFS